jgi:endonuclease YncB( thermonuclease family)
LPLALLMALLAERSVCFNVWYFKSGIIFGRALTAALGLALVATAQAGELVGQVVRVHDGDTLTILVDRHQVRVRLVEIDAPELGQPFGRRSQDSLAAMCAGVVATVTESGRDRYGRTLGRVTCRGTDANAEQVRRGMAWVYVRYARKNSPLYTVQTDARLEHRGLWSDAHAAPPWIWRRQHRERTGERMF